SEDEAALIGADDLAAAAAESQEAEPHLLEPGGAELDLRLVLGHDVELRRLALAADLDRIADSLVKGGLGGLAAAGDDAGRAEGENQGQAHQRRPGNWQLRSCSASVRKRLLSGDCSTRRGTSRKVVSPQRP